MATKQLKASDFTADDAFWENEHGDRSSVLLSSYTRPVPIARILHGGADKAQVQSLARLAGGSFSQVREIEVSNTGLVLKVASNGKMTEDEARELRDLFLEELQSHASGKGGRSRTQRIAGRQPVTAGGRARFHRDIAGRQRRSGGGAGA